MQTLMIKDSWRNAVTVLLLTVEAEGLDGKLD